MDNAPVHRGWYMIHDNHAIRKLPPYSLMLNPIEMAFNYIKTAIKRRLNESMGIILDRGAAAAANQTLITYRMGHLRVVVVEVLGRLEIQEHRMAN